MATASLSIPIQTGIQYAFTNISDTRNGGSVMFVKSSASAPSPCFAQNVFQYNLSNTFYTMYWFRMPADYASGPVVKIQWKTLATASTQTWIAYFAAITPGDAETPNEKAIGGANSNTSPANPTEARRLIEVSITISDPNSVAAGDWVCLMIQTDFVILNDIEIVGIALEYTTT